ncbi:MAG: GLPGLI family protein [Bacteroides sp.]|nr:GLPGLI family protein [Bacteroides sp.]
MKRFYTIFLISLIYSSILFAQETKEIEPAVWECKYNYFALRDTVSKEAFKEDILILRIGESTSSFFSQYTFRRLDINAQKADPNNPLLGIIQDFLYDEEYRYYENTSILDYIYQNYPEGNMTVQARHEKTVFRYEEPLSPQQWNIVPDSTRQIIDHTCQLATCYYRGRDYRAWFAPDIPVQTGPWKFYGLPGLIMEVYDTDKHHHYQITEISPNADQPVTIYFFPEQKPSTRKEVASVLREGMARVAAKNKEKGENPPVCDFMEKDY